MGKLVLPADYECCNDSVFLINNFLLFNSLGGCWFDFGIDFWDAKSKTDVSRKPGKPVEEIKRIVSDCASRVGSGNVLVPATRTAGNLTDSLIGW